MSPAVPLPAQAPVPVWSFFQVGAAATTGSLHGSCFTMNPSLSSPARSPTVKRKGSVRRARAPSHLPPLSQEAHDAALYSIRNYLKGRTSYDTFPVSFRLIVLDSDLEVRKALQCLLSNGLHPPTLMAYRFSCAKLIIHLSSPLL